MCHDELGDELGFDEFDDEIFVMTKLATNLATKFRRQNRHDECDDQIFVILSISSSKSSPNLSWWKFRRQIRHDKNFVVKFVKTQFVA